MKDLIIGFIGIVLLMYSTIELTIRLTEKEIREENSVLIERGKLLYQYSILEAKKPTKKDKDWYNETESIFKRKKDSTVNNLKATHYGKY